MNSMNNIKEEVSKRFENIRFEEVSSQQLSIDMKKDNIHSALAYLKSIGWDQLTFLTCVDWIEMKKFQLVYVLMNWDEGITINLRTEIDRDNPIMDSIISIFPGAEYYERDVHEFFGVNFPGNPNYEKDLFLEIWDDMPPMRKDFDPLAYSKRKFPDREYKAEFIPEGDEL